MKEMKHFPQECICVNFVFFSLPLVLQLLLPSSLLFPKGKFRPKPLRITETLNWIQVHPNQLRGLQHQHQFFLRRILGSHRKPPIIRAAEE